MEDSVVVTTEERQACVRNAFPKKKQEVVGKSEFRSLFATILSQTSAPWGKKYLSR